MIRVQPGLRAVNLSKARLLDRLHNVNADLATQVRNTKLEWYTMRNQASEEPGAAEIFVYDEIGGSFGIGAQDFINDLNAIDSDEIVVRINSPGGLLVDAIAISSALAQHPAKIVTRVDGMAASAASIIAIAGDRVEMMDGSQMMIHDVMVQGAGNAKEFRELVDWLEEQSENVARMYAKRAGGNVEDWRNLMLAETWMFADETVASGLADAVFTRDKKFNALPPGEEEETPDEEEETPEEEPTESSEESDEEDEEISEDDAIDALMHRPHRLTNRGYKYHGRNKAPAPTTRKSFADLLDGWR